MNQLYSDEDMMGFTKKELVKEIRVWEKRYKELCGYYDNLYKMFIEANKENKEK